MTQPASIPTSETSAASTPLVSTLTELDPAPEFLAWATPRTTVADIWVNCPRGDWLLWFCFRQAPNLTERQRLAGCLATMMTSYITTQNMPTSSSYTAATGALAALRSFAAGATSAAMLNRLALPLEVTKPVSTTSAGILEFELVQAVSDVVRACAGFDPEIAAQWASKYGTCMCFATLRLGVIADFPGAQEALAAAVRGAVPFKDFTTPSGP